MTKRPSLQTERLLLRPFSTGDAKTVQRLANCKEVTSTTLQLPYPYRLHHAEEWIATHQSLYQEKQQVIFAVTLIDTKELVGAIGMRYDKVHENAEIGYWIGHDFWNKGFATEAARAMVEFGFGKMALHRIYAHFMVHNPASGKVMKKLGMQFDGIMREHVKKDGEFIDLHLYSILRKEWQQQYVK
ncbi:MAG: GNAT family N-acetyltransferase [Deferribacteres bacterium]|nr:GNAT family N-acetyltransferase [candidate division KSB1 bacterium]MCB9501677.1 GNAT family N-acetyltransferase [Deferribacteres bacterium]